MNQFVLGLEIGMHLGRALVLIVEEIKKHRSSDGVKEVN